MTIIEALQNNKMAFGLMHTDEFTNEEMQAKAREISGDNFKWYITRDNGTWVSIDMTSRVFVYDITYRLRPDYKEQDEYELCEITDNGSVLVFCRNSQSCPSTIDRVTTDPNFAGYLYEDGLMKADSVRYFAEDGSEIFHVAIQALRSGLITIKRPYPNGHVVFSKNK